MAVALGTVYEISVDEKAVAHLQVVTLDETLPGSAVVRVFKKHILREVDPNLAEIVRGDAAFYVHVFPKAGETLKIWRRVGCSDIADLPHLTWYVPPVERLRDSTCDQWEFWETNRKRKVVSSDDARLNNAEFGMVGKSSPWVARKKSPALSSCNMIERAHKLR